MREATPRRGSGQIYKNNYDKNEGAWARVGRLEDTPAGLRTRPQGGGHAHMRPGHAHAWYEAKVSQMRMMDREGPCLTTPTGRRATSLTSGYAPPRCRPRLRRTSHAHSAEASRAGVMLRSGMGLGGKPRPRRKATPTAAWSRRLRLQEWWRGSQRLSLKSSRLP